MKPVMRTPRGSLAMNTVDYRYNANCKLSLSNVLLTIRFLM